jgi:hypothetical protein
MKKIVLLSVLMSYPLYADRAMIPIRPNISIYEPGQKAIIAWEESLKIEILILAVDAYADTTCKVLEILPLPSEPKIEKSDIQPFRAIQALVRKHTPVNPYRGKGPPPGFDGVRKDGVEIKFHKKIGAHDITCVKALNFQEFVNWTHDFIVSQEIDTLLFPTGLRSIIGSYMRKGIVYFIFDIIELGNRVSSIDPLIYRFTSPYPYFPLQISSLAEGDTKIQLFLLTEQSPTTATVRPFKFGKYLFYGSKLEDITINFKLTKEELGTIEPSITKLMTGDVWLTALELETPAKKLTSDLRIRKFRDE